MRGDLLLYQSHRPLLLFLAAYAQLLVGSSVAGAATPSQREEIQQRPNIPQLPPPASCIAQCSSLPSSQEVMTHLDQLRQRHGEHIATESIGRTAEGRDVILVRLYPGNPSIRYPIVLGIFGQHGDEHDSTVLGLDLLDRLADGPPLDFEVDLIPQMNPDGADADLSGTVPPLTCRKNRRPESRAVGVDLNRNWGYGWGAGPPPSSINYPGSGPFSEAETRAVRDWLQTQSNVRLVMDVHSGQSTFDQGTVGFPFAGKEDGGLASVDRPRLAAIADNLARTLSDPADPRPALSAMQSHEVRAHVERAIRAHFPVIWPIVAWTSLPPSTIAPGSSIDWVYGTLCIPAFGLELSRPPSQAELPTYSAIVERRRQGLAMRLENWFRTRGCQLL